MCDDKANVVLDADVVVGQKGQQLLLKCVLNVSKPLEGKSAR